MERLVPGFVLTSRYRLDHLVAAGGMGQVWAVTDGVLGRTVAVKVMHPQTQEQQALAARFRAEARFAAQISHPNVVEVFDFGEHDGLAYLVMEFIDGPTLAGLLEARGTLPADVVRSVLCQLAGALERPHAHGIVHRDLKPSNVLITPDGYVKLMDFGIAKDVGAGASHTLTGEVLGTTYYISPEQALGDAVTPRSDLYSLGVVGHELLTDLTPPGPSSPSSHGRSCHRQRPSLPHSSTAGPAHGRRPRRPARPRRRGGCPPGDAYRITEVAHRVRRTPERVGVAQRTTRACTT